MIYEFKLTAYDFILPLGGSAYDASVGLHVSVEDYPVAVEVTDEHGEIVIHECFLKTAHGLKSLSSGGAQGIMFDLIEAAALKDHIEKICERLEVPRFNPAVEYGTISASAL